MGVLGEPEGGRTAPVGRPVAGACLRQSKGELYSAPPQVPVPSEGCLHFLA